VSRLSYRHRGGGTPLIGETIDAYLRGVTARHGAREAIVSLDQNARLTYAGLDLAVQSLARGLLGLGVGRGERVGIWSTDNAEWVLLQLATARIGAVLVNVNPAYRAAELEYALRTARVHHLFLIPSFRGSNYVAMIRELCPMGPPSARLPDLKNVVVYDPRDPGATAPQSPGLLTWPEVLELGGPVADSTVSERAAELDPDDPINIQFTSGTTGFPKGVVLTHHNILNNGYFIGEVLRLTERDRLCVPVPFYHCFGMVVSTLACLTHGAALIIPAPHFDPAATLAAVERERCTALHGVPTMFIQELARQEKDRRDLSSLRTGIMAGAPCPPELMRRVIEEMGIRDLLIGYGQTEASPVTHTTRPEDPFERRVNTVGTNLDHQEVKIVDTRTGRVVPTGVAGEVCFRGYHVMLGYFENDAATRETIDEAGWLHSGDVGVMDDDGYVAITGRIKDMIIRGGEKIFPAEIEAHYFQHPKVSEIAVFGVPDETMGEQVGAWIRLRPGVSAQPEEFQEWSRGKIAHYKIPKFVWIVDEFPMTVTGKIQKFKIRETVRDWVSRRPPARGDKAGTGAPTDRSGR
jgi:fatty-acyl-CoA synthase